MRSTQKVLQAQIKESDADISRFSVGTSSGGSLKGFTAAALDVALLDMRAMGATWIRTDLNWWTVQGAGATSWDWSAHDFLVSHANAASVGVVLCLAYTPPWARTAGTGNTAPNNNSDYAAFVSAAVTHYSPMGVRHYEIWNEPNIGFLTWSSSKVVKYTAMLQAAFTAAKTANPSCVVITGGLAPAGGYGYAPDADTLNQVSFLEQMYANGAHGYFDAVGYHPYAWPADTTGTNSANAWYQMIGDPAHSYQVYDGSVWNPSVRSLMIANGDGAKKVYSTEFGMPSNNGTGLTEANQSAHIATGLALWKTYTWASGMMIYSYQDFINGGVDPDSFPYYGVTRLNGTHKPVWDAIRLA